MPVSAAPDKEGLVTCRTPSPLALALLLLGAGAGGAAAPPTAMGGHALARRIDHHIDAALAGARRGEATEVGRR
jgi:hypothetical protein